MKEALMGFEKSRDFLICIDSDGCALDTMDVKHMRCFAPCLVCHSTYIPFTAVPGPATV